MGTLTVRENLHFSAALRLPDKLSKRKRQERVDAILNDLGLFCVAESKVSLVSSFAYNAPIIGHPLRGGPRARKGTSYRILKFLIPPNLKGTQSNQS